MSAGLSMESDPVVRGALGKRETFPAPVIVESSQEWDGIDGPWSSFILQVGTPPQQVRVDISIEGQETWVVDPGGCALETSGTTSDCADSRGGLFNDEDSSTWQSTTTIWNNSGIYELSGLITKSLGLNGNGEYGFETVGLSFDGADGPTLNHTIVAMFNTTNFYMGQFGVSPNPTHFTVTNNNLSALDDPQPSYFSKLNTTGAIPSLSYSFTAGSYSRRNSFKNALGSFIFGGYDASLKGSTGQSFDFALDEGRELLVGIQSITKASDDGTTELLPQSIFAALESSQPNIWLPREACQRFEKAFNLTWNATAEQYLVDSTLHERLVEEDSKITFRLGNGGSGGQTSDIVLPYGAFDLNLSKSTSDPQRYFPLKIANNDTQYTLGRAFFQEAYLIADYGRRNFSLSQRAWNNSASRNIVAIHAKNQSDTSSEGRSLSAGAIAGIVLGVLLGLTILAWAWWRRRRTAMLAPKRLASSEGVQDAESIAPGEHELAKWEGIPAVDAKPLAHQHHQHVVELPTDSQTIHEMDAGPFMPELADTAPGEARTGATPTSQG